MLSLRIIEREFDRQRYDTLLGVVAANGSPLPLPFRARMSQQPATAVALGLLRHAELTYGPTPIARRMVSFLLDHANAPSLSGDPLAAAAVVAALQRAKLCAPQHQQTMDRAVDSLLQSLAAAQDDDGLFAGPDDRTRQDRAMVTAAVLWFLRDLPDLGLVIRLPDAMGWLEQHMHALPAETELIWRLARLPIQTAAARRSAA